MKRGLKRLPASLPVLSERPPPLGAPGFGDGAPFTASSVIQAILAGLPSIADSDPGQSAPKPLPQRGRLQVDMIHPVGAGSGKPFDAQRFWDLMNRRR